VPIWAHCRIHVTFVCMGCMCVHVSEEQRLDHLAMKHFYDDKLHDSTQPSQRRL